MSFKDQAGLDLDVFFNPDEFGETVTYVPEDGSGSREIIAVVDSSSTGPGVHTDHALIYVKASDVPSPEYRDSFVIQGETWRVYRDQDKGRAAKKAGGVWIVIINKDERFNGYGYK